LPSAARNLVIDRVDTDYVALVENDVLFTPGWLETLIEACEVTPADVASPIIYEGRGTSQHFDQGLGTIVESESHPGKYEVKPLDVRRNEVSVRTIVEFVEQHCLVFRMSAFEGMGHFAELNTRDDVDLGLALRNGGCVAVLEPDAKVHFVGPTGKVNDDELPFYEFRWDLEGARRSREEIQERWNLIETPGDLGFVTYRNLMARLPSVREDLRSLVSRPGTTLLVDNGDWIDGDVTRDLSVSPFPNAGGHFGGFPASDQDAVEMFDRALEEGAGRIVIGYPAYWWLAYLPKFELRLRETCRLERDDDLLKVFEVRSD
jgi:hypothetical protein